jgi:hypothetical protein
MTPRKMLMTEEIEAYMNEVAVGVEGIIRNGDPLIMDQAVADGFAKRHDETTWYRAGAIKKGERRIIRTCPPCSHVLMVTEIIGTGDGEADILTSYEFHF